MPPESAEKLVAAIEGLAGEVRMLRDVMEEFRVCFEWAVNNDRFRRAADEWVPTPHDYGLRTADIENRTDVLTTTELEETGKTVVPRAKLQRTLFERQSSQTRTDGSDDHPPALP